MPKNPYPTISKGDDGNWHAWVPVGTKPNGEAERRHVKRTTKAAVIERVDEILDQVRSGAVVRSGPGMTVSQWLDLYLDTVLPSSGRCDPDTVRDYRSKIEHWVLPVIGKMRVDRVQTENAEIIYLAMRRAGRADSTVLKVHRILSRAFEIALRRSLVPRNVFKLMDSPTFDAPDQTPLTQEEAQRFLDEADRRGRNSARWKIALALGLRQGEALGLRKQFLDLEAANMKVWWQLRRRSFDHGCGGACGRRRGGNCPQRTMQLRPGEEVVLDLSKPESADRRLGLVFKRPKGKSKREIPLPDELVDALRQHLRAQAIEEILADSLWQDHDLVFCEPDGSPIDPSKDYAEWQDILKAAGVPASKLHNARHTAATIMILLGVPAEVVQEILGHSDLRTTRGYMHVASEMAKNATQRMGRVLLTKATAP
ncbi:tyrosine-type recombinase/integrase [Actinoplanes sp. NPDC048796]|uniref:tyrosine-type recombinase/integrase n=1 Tax=Actinoplanes sp. NPDC048796 TaxID=3155640 RepID=UPI0034076E7E